MKPLIVLIAVFLLGTIFLRLWRKKYAFKLAARIAMSVMLVFSATGHFLYTKGMAMMLPPLISFRTAIVYVTGVIEIVAAVALLIPFTYKPAGWFLIIFFVCILPGNVYAAIHHVDYQKATFDGPGPEYLFFRIPLQAFFIGWVYFSAIRAGKREGRQRIGLQK